LSISPVEEGEVGLALQQALDAMSDVYVVYDSSWRFVFQNRAQREAMKRAGLDPDWAMGKVLWEVMPFLAGTAGEAGTRKAMAERVVTEWEESYPPDLRLHGRAFPTPDGGVAVVARDVSEQWKAEMLHRAAEERTFALQKTTAALASAMTVDRLAEVILSQGIPAIGAQAASVVLVKEDGEMHIIAYAGYDPAFMAEFEHFSIDSDYAICHAARSGKPVIMNSVEERDARYPHLAETRKLFGGGAVAAIPLLADDRVLGGLGFTFPEGRVLDSDDVDFMTTLAQQCAQGIERARLYEAEKDARARAEEANKAKTDFLTMMSHELRTPLNAIGGYADLMQAGIRGPVTEDQILDLQRIKRNQHHLLSLINDVLNFAKLQAGIVNVIEREFDLDNVASGIEALVTPQIIAKDLSYRFIGATERCVCCGDPEKVEQILLNLLSNAIKFTESGGVVTMSIESSDGFAEVRVSDTGVGISPDKLQMVFEPFVQLNRSRTSINEGTGLGLAISRDLARAMNGELSVESNVGSGSTFKLRLARINP